MTGPHDQKSAEELFEAHQASSRPIWLSPKMSLVVFLLSPILFPLILIPYAGAFITWAGNHPAWQTLFFTSLVIMGHATIDVMIRDVLRQNSKRLEGAIKAQANAVESVLPIALFLRAFHEDRSYSDLGGGFSIFEELEHGLRSEGYFPLALGANLPVGPDHGVAFIETSEATWWEAFCAAANAAGVIIVAPDDTPSLRREIAWLATNHQLEKVLFVMTPRSRNVLAVSGDVPTAHPAGPDKARMASWEAFRTSFRTLFNVSLPPYDPRGGLVWTDGGNQTTITTMRTVDEPEKLANDYRSDYGVKFDLTIKHAMEGLPPPTHSIRDFWSLLPSFAKPITGGSVLKPPGSTGLEWQTLKLYSAVSWGTVLGFLLVCLLGYVGVF